MDGLAGPATATDADLLVFPSWPIDLPPADADLIAIVDDAHRRGARIAGLCLGAFPIAASGVLDGRTAVTHWAAADALAAQRPAVNVQRSALYIDHGDILTSAGTASAIDACLHVVRAELGSAAASTVARHLVVAPHRDGDQAQFIERPVAQPDDQRLRQAMEWALRRLGEPTTLADLARHAFMSPRTFTRRFGEATGMSPIAWLARRRIEASLALLEESDRPVEEVAAAVGFATATAFRKAFRRQVGLAPGAYRRRFR
jgi:transcriptional regulator GlxA family with amidase domain